jgi:mannosyltransferase
MTSPRGSSAVGGPAGGDEVATASAAGGAARAEAVAASGLPAGEAPPAAAPDAEPKRYDAGPAWARWLPPAVALLICLWRINRPSFWRDEAATIAAIRRPLGDLIRMLGNVDAVHGAYYFMMWPIEHVLGPGALAMRLPSAIAAALAVAAIAATGRRLISPWAGLAAGLFLAILPVTSRYGQEARSYELVVAAATIASYLLVRVLAAEPAARRRWIVGYAVSLAALGVLNIFGLLMIPAHALTVVVVYRRNLRDPAARRLVVGWLAAVAVGVVVSSPLLVLAWLQRGQIAWLSVNTSSSGLNTLYSLSGSFLATTAALAVILVALVLSTEFSKQRRTMSWPARLWEISLPWLVVPPLILLIASHVQPVYTSRYILICVPALALIGGAAIASYGKFAGAIALAVVLIAGATTQVGQRTYAGHYDDILAVDQIVAAHARPGDYVLYTNPNAESFGAAYPFGLGKLPNIALKQGPIPSATLGGSIAPLAQIRSRLAHAKRVWVVEINKLVTDPELLGLNGLPVSETPILAGLPLAFRAYWHERGDYLILFTHI